MANAKDDGTIIEQLRRIIVEELDANLSPEQIDTQTPLFETGIGLDSLAVLDLVLLIESHFGFEFADEDLDVAYFRNLKTLAELVGRKTGRRPHG